MKHGKTTELIYICKYQLVLIQVISVLAFKSVLEEIQQVLCYLRQVYNHNSRRQLKYVKGHNSVIPSINSIIQVSIYKTFTHAVSCSYLTN